MFEELITICSVNWYSCSFLQELFHNLIAKAQNPEKLKFIVVDNTNGRDINTEKLTNPFQNTTIIKNNPKGFNGSQTHSHGLNIIMKNIQTPYALILDPDIHIFKQNWDSFLINLVSENNVFAAGASYPPWQTGKYHNFPNPIFCFIKTQQYLDFSPGWSAYDVKKNVLYWDFIRRNFLRLGIFINRKRFENSIFIKTVWPYLERIIGICSRDTGWRIAQKAYKNKTPAIIFEPKLIGDKQLDARNPYSVIAKYFELYAYKNEPILTHKYSTNSIVFKTKKSDDTNLWLNLIQQIEKND